MKFFAFIVLMLGLVACEDPASSGTPPPAGPDTAGTAMTDSLNPTTRGRAWYIDFSEQEGEILRRDPGIEAIKDNPAKLIAEINQAFRNEAGETPGLELTRRSGDTVFVRLANEALLTEGMGTSGASDLIGVTTYTLTEVSGIRWVHFSFAPGEHAMPGLYDRSKVRAFVKVEEVR